MDNRRKVTDFAEGMLYTLLVYVITTGVYLLYRWIAN